MGSRFSLKGSTMRILASGLVGLALVSGAATSIFAQHSSTANLANKSQAIRGGVSHSIAASGTVDMRKATPVTAAALSPKPRISPTDRPNKTAAQLAAYQQYVLSHPGALPKATAAPALKKTNIYGGGASPVLLKTVAGINSTQAGGWYPPDQAIGTIGGMTIEGVNDLWIAYDGTFGVKYGPFTAEQLFAPVKLAGDTFSDPQITWQVGRGHWLISWLEISNTGNGKDYLDIAISTGVVPSPLTNWKVYRIDPGVANADDFCDYPTLGYDYWAMYVTCITFSISNTNPQTNNTFAFPITGMLSGSFSFDFWYSVNTSQNCGTACTPAYRISPAIEDGGAPQAEWVAATDQGTGASSSNLTLCSITNTIATGTATVPTYTCTFTSLPVGYNDPIGAAQPGTAVKVYPGVGFKQFALRAGRLEFAMPMAMNCSGNVHDGIVWYTVVPQLTTFTAHSPQWVNGIVSGYSDGGYFCYSGADAYMPTLAGSSEGELTLVFNYSDSLSTFPSIVFTGRSAADAPGTMQQGGGGFWVVQGIHSNDSGRFGDYSACSLDYDYTARGTLVCAGEYGGAHTALGGFGWDTEIYKIRMI